jgi:hypothetical protein
MDQQFKYSGEIYSCLLLTMKYDPGSKGKIVGGYPGACGTNGFEGVERRTVLRAGYSLEVN